jgi:hypothetical protein
VKNHLLHIVDSQGIQSSGSRSLRSKLGGNGPSPSQNWFLPPKFRDSVLHSAYPQPGSTKLERKLQRPAVPRLNTMRTSVCSARSVEQRRAVRFGVQARVIYRWTDQSGRNQEGVGCTRNISISGVFVVCPSLPSVGTPVGLEIHLPPFALGALQNLRLETEGKVTRVTGIDQESGFAATSQCEMHEILP